MPLFSVIIALYNKENFIENTINSILQQCFTNYEVIIVNDGSTDKSEEKVLAFEDPRIRYFFKENGGVSSARNYGIEKAKTNYITFIDADDYWYPDFLQEMYRCISKFPNQKVFSAAIEIETSKTMISSRYSIEKTGNYEIVSYFEASKKETVICTSCAVFHKSVFEKIGCFDINLKSGEDTDMWIRIGLNYSILFVWKKLARYGYDPNSLSKNHKTSVYSFNFSKYAIWEKNNPSLKKFLDLNRFSLAIKSKLIGEQDFYLKLYKAIDLQNMPLKKRILLKLPVYVLRPLITLKTLLANVGLGHSVFK